MDYYVGMGRDNVIYTVDNDNNMLLIEPVSGRSYYVSYWDKIVEYVESKKFASRAEATIFIQDRLLKYLCDKTNVMAPPLYREALEWGVQLPAEITAMYEVDRLNRLKDELSCVIRRYNKEYNLNLKENCDELFTN